MTRGGFKNGIIGISLAGILSACGSQPPGTQGQIVLFEQGTKPAEPEETPTPDPTFSQKITLSSYEVPRGGSLIIRTTFRYGDPKSVSGTLSLPDGSDSPLNFVFDGTDWVTTYVSQLTTLPGDGRIQIIAAFTLGEAIVDEVPFRILGIHGTESGLVALYRFDEGSGTTAMDQSSYANHGTISGAVYQAGGYDSQLYFDGSNDAVEIADAPSLNLTNSMTIEAWIKSNLPPVVSTNPVTGIIRKGFYDAGEQYMMGISRTGAVFCGLNDVSFQTSYQLILTDIWHHLACSFDGTKLKLYVDGVLVSTRVAGIPFNIITGPTPLRIGAGIVDASDWRFKGWMDEVAIWNTVRTEREVCADGGGVWMQGNLGSGDCEYPFYPR